MRAAEQLRSPELRMLEDPFARIFLGRTFCALLSAAEAVGWPLDDPLGMTTYVVARHRYIDDGLQRALSSGVEQVVLLGAGYDTRAFRFGEAAAGRPLFFELDHPTTSQRKARIVAEQGGRLPRACVRAVEIDFSSQSLTERLVAAGFLPERPSFFIWEGVSMYLAEGAVRATLAELLAIARGGAEVAVELWRGRSSPDPLVAAANRLGTLGLRLIFGEPVLFGLSAAAARGFFERIGFELLELADAPLLRSRYAGQERRIWTGNYLVRVAPG